jgi:FMN phosphatase YigB (HAD superfamily)
MQHRWKIPFEQMIYVGDNVEKDFLSKSFLSDKLEINPKKTFPFFKRVISSELYPFCKATLKSFFFVSINLFLEIFIDEVVFFL